MYEGPQLYRGLPCAGTYVYIFLCGTIVRPLQIFPFPRCLTPSVGTGKSSPGGSTLDASRFVCSRIAIGLT